MRLRNWLTVPVTIAAAALLVGVGSGCQPKLDLTHKTDSYSTFGDLIYKEVCQRVAYTGELADQAAGTRTTIDVSGTMSTAVCINGTAPPADATQKLKAIVPEKPTIVSAVDLVLPKSLLDDTRDLLTAMLPLTDDGTMETSITSVASLMTDMHNDVDLSPALERVNKRSGMRPLAKSPGMMPIMINYPQIDDLLGKLLDLITAGGTGETEWKALLAASSLELRASKYVDDPSDPERTLALALNLMFSQDPALGTDSERWAVVRDFRGVAQVATLTSGDLPDPFVDMDGDGLADIDAHGSFVDENGAPIKPPTPFPAPGVMDTAERDDQGRALVSGDTTLLYDYVDLDSTVLAAVMRDSTTLLDPDKNTLLGLLWGANALLGPRVATTKNYVDANNKPIGSLAYSGHDTSASAPLLDLAHAFVQLLGDPGIRDTLQGASTLVQLHESAATRAIQAMFDVNDLGAKYPGAQLKATSMLYDDMAPLVTRIVSIPGLTEDLVAAMQNPHVRGLAPMIARMMQARNQVDFDHSDSPDFTFDPGSLDLVDQVDRTKLDSDYNRSLFQRISHLIWETNGTQFCNKDGAEVIGIGPFKITRDHCKLFEVDDLGLFFVLLMASPDLITATKGTAREATTYDKASFCKQITDSTMAALVGNGGALADITLQTLIGITDFTCLPTPAAATRSLFLLPSEQSTFMQNTTDPVTGRSGIPFTTLNAKSIFAWEAKLDSNPAGAIDASYYDDTFYDAIRPLVDAFAKHDECLVARGEDGTCPAGQSRNAAKILVDFLGMLHTHWPSPSSTVNGMSWQPDITKPYYARTDNAISYEPLLIEALSKSDLVPSILDLAPILSTLTVDGFSDGLPALPAIAKTARYVFDPSIQPVQLAYRNGATTTVLSDGVTPGPRVTTYYLLADAYAAKKVALAQADTAQAVAWTSGAHELTNLFLTIDKTSTTTTAYEFHNRHVFAMTPILINFLIDRVTSHTLAGDVDTWSHLTLTSNVSDSIAGPMFTALGDLAQRINENSDLRSSIYALLQYLFVQTGDTPPFDVQLATVGDLLQTVLDDGNMVPIARSLGNAMDPGKGAVNTQLSFLKKVRAVDTKKVMLKILQNLYHVDARTLYPASDLADVMAEMNRVKPGVGGLMNAADYTKMFSELNDFFTDEKRGFQRFIDVVKSRTITN